MTLLTEIQIAFLTISCFASILAIIVKLIQHKEVFAKPNLSSRLLLCLAVSDLIGASGWLLQVWIRSCPSMMVINFFGFKSASLFCNAVGFQLVTRIRVMQVRDIWFYVIPYGVTGALVILFVGLEGYHPMDSPLEKCWFKPTHGLIFSRGTDCVVFAINTLLFGYTTYRILKSRQEFNNNRKMKGKERRLYFIIACFFLRTCFSMLVLFKSFSQYAMLATCLQGFLNALAMNGKEMQTAFYNLYKYHSFSGPLTLISKELQRTTDSPGPLMINRPSSPV